LYFPPNEFCTTGLQPMTNLSGLSTGLAFLPSWLSDTAEPNAMDKLMSAWVKANGWRSAGFAWPCGPEPTVVIMARAEASDRPPYPPGEIAEVARSLEGGTSTVVWQVPSSAGRLYTLVSPAGHPPGIIWIDRGPSEPWTDLDRSYLTASARLIEKSHAITQLVGSVVDHERLQQRLNDAAVIAGRMAHDFDNILTGIIGFADLTVPMVQAGSQQAKFIGEISKVGQRGIQFTQQLHQLSRSGQVKPMPGSVPTAIIKEEARLRPVMPVSCSVLSHAPATLPAVAMEMGPLQIVIGHLMQNAVEATPSTGPVIVNTRAVELNPTAGAHIEISFQDAGPGIKQEVQAKLFAEPFFTTKVRHRGLGLCIAYRVLYAHRGGIRIDSTTETPHGTTVRIVIPLAAARPVVVASLPQPAHNSPSVKG
jgi:signal transduction histidine kinase